MDGADVQKLCMTDNVVGSVARNVPSPLNMATTNETDFKNRSIGHLPRSSPPSGALTTPRNRRIFRATWLAIIVSGFSTVERVKPFPGHLKYFALRVAGRNQLQRSRVRTAGASRIAPAPFAFKHNMPMMNLPIAPPFPPMEARSVAAIPEGPQWEYEPKWDGFRCLLFRDGGKVELQSKSCRPLTRYFPEVVEAATALADDRFVLDGELVVPRGKIFSFDDLLQRIHPAASRIARLALETPAAMVAFDLLVDSGGNSLLAEPQSVRRSALEALARRNFPAGGAFRLSPATTRLAEARRWLSGLGATLDGIIAKRRDLPYRSGDRSGMEKIKTIRSADCVVGGFRYHEGRKIVGSLLLGLYNDRGLLDHVGFTSTIKAAEKPALTRQLEQLIEPPGFTGSAPGGPSRWSSQRSTAWQPLKPELVVEVDYDHFSDGRFRHGTHLLRWRPDKSPRQCTMDQIAQRQSDLEVLAQLP